MTAHPVRLPRVNANDETARLSAWLVEEWDFVRPRQPIALMETTKAVVELESTGAGLVVAAAAIGEEVAVGDPVAFLLPHKDVALAASLKAQRRDLSSGAPGAESRPVSARARRAMATHHIAIEDLPGCGPIRERDVTALVACREARILTESEAREAVDALATGETCMILFGAAMQGEVVLDCLEGAGSFTTVALVDDRPKARSLAGLPVLSANWLEAVHARGVRLAHVCIGDSAARLACGERLRRIGFEIVNVVHPTAVISPAATLGRGVFVGPLALVGPQVRIADFVQINNAATIAHHTVVGQGTRISDGAHVGGEVNVGERVLLGIGVSVNTRVTIGSDSVVASGVALYGDVPPRSIVRADGKSYLAGHHG